MTMEKRKVLASNGYVGILKIDYDQNKILTTLNNRWGKLYYTDNDTYFYKYGVKYSLNEFFRTNGSL